MPKLHERGFVRVKGTPSDVCCEVVYVSENARYLSLKLLEDASSAWQEGDTYRCSAEHFQRGHKTVAHLLGR